MEEQSRTYILEASDLSVSFETDAGEVQAVRDVSLSLKEGEVLAIVGESGCGKSTTGRVILRLLEATSGQVLFEGKDILSLSEREMREMRREMQIIFQDPFSSINPRKSISETIAEPIRRHRIITNKREREEKVFEIMKTVGLAERFYNAYPHELDGGRRQRVGIARALALNPKFIVCDEPVSALDVSIQAQILNLMQELQEQMGLTYMFITHDLSVVNHFSDEIAVMYLGQIVERAPTDEIFEHPVHPYTQALLSAIPVPSLRNRRKRILLKGELTSPVNPAPVCRFANRCIYATERCRGEEPALREISKGHFVSCFLADEKGKD